MIGIVATIALSILVAILIPLRFARAVRRSPRDPEFRSLFVLVVMTLAAGTVFYWQIEGWSLLDAFYFSVIVLTTVGLGDIAPRRRQANSSPCSTSLPGWGSSWDS